MDLKSMVPGSEAGRSEAPLNLSFPVCKLHGAEQPSRPSMGWAVQPAPNGGLPEHLPQPLLSHVSLSTAGRTSAGRACAWAVLGLTGCESPSVAAWPEASVWVVQVVPVAPTPWHPPGTMTCIGPQEGPGRRSGRGGQGRAEHGSWAAVWDVGEGLGGHASLLPAPSSEISVFPQLQVCSSLAPQPSRLLTGQFLLCARALFLPAEYLPGAARILERLPGDLVPEAPLGAWHGPPGSQLLLSARSRLPGPAPGAPESVGARAPGPGPCRRPWWADPMDGMRQESTRAHTAARAPNCGRSSCGTPEGLSLQAHPDQRRGLPWLASRLESEAGVPGV